MTSIADNTTNEHQKVPADMKRSDHWPAARSAHLIEHPTCLICGGTKKLEVHHIKPFHVHPELELDPSNFATLCEDNLDGLDCHLAFGHLGNFKSWNVDVLVDAAFWSLRIKNRPTVEVA